MKIIKLLFLITVYILSFRILYANVYRAYEVFRAGSFASGMGGTGTSLPNSISFITENPAMVAELNSFSIAFGVDAQLLLSRLLTDFVIDFYIPLLAFSIPTTENSGFGFAFYTPFQRKLLGTEIYQYNIDLTYSYTIHSFITIALTVGPSFSVQSNKYIGGGYTFAFSSIMRFGILNFGIYYRRSAHLFYSFFVGNEKAEEKMPDILKTGISKEWKNLQIGQLRIKKISLALELEYIFWQLSFLKSKGKNITPPIHSGLTHFIHPHIGVSILFENFLRGLILQGGFFTEDYIDSLGNNDTQFLISFGIGGYAGNVQWKNQLRIQLSYISSYLLSLAYRGNNQVEKIQITIEYLH